MNEGSILLAGMSWGVFSFIIAVKIFKSITYVEQWVAVFVPLVLAFLFYFFDSIKSKQEV